MKDVKKIVAMVLALVMMMSIVTGCSYELVAYNEPTHTEAEPTVEPTVESTEAPTEATTETTEATQYASVVFVSVNPLFAIYFDADGNVIKTTAENDDGEALDVDLEALSDKTSADAVTALLTAIAEAGYFEDGEHNIELTFYGETEAEVEDPASLGEMEKAIYEAAETYVAEKEIKAEVKVKQSPAAAEVEADNIPSEPPHVHNYKSETVDATCTEGGYTTHTCDCGDSYTDNEAAKLDHSYHGDTISANCTDGGYTQYECERCGDSYTDGYTDKLGHDYHGDTVDATCTEGGYTKYTCNRCGSNYTDKETEKLGHDFKTEVVKATYETGGYTIYTCNRCGHTYEDNRTAPLPKPTEPSEEPTEEEPTTEPDAETDTTEPSKETTEANTETEPETTGSEVECSYCGGPHFLYECPVAAEDIANKEPEAEPCFFCGSTECDYPKTGDVNKCKGYDEKKDATKYCQTCGESTSVCEFWVVDKKCPRCGEEVAAFACHHCPKR